MLSGLRDGTWASRQRLQAYGLMLLVGYGLMIAWLLATSHGLVDSYGRPIGTDFVNVWSSGRMALEGQAAAAFDPVVQAPYQQQLLGFSTDFFYGWHYPPMFLLVAAGLALMPYGLALFIWLAGTGALYLATIRRIMAGATGDTWLVTLLAFAYPAVLANVTHGQNGCLNAALLGGAMALLPSHPATSGILIGLLAYKPQYGIIVPFALLAAGHWRALASAAMTTIATVLISLAVFGTASWAAFFKFGAFTKEAILEQGAAGWFKLQGVFPAVRMLGGSIGTAYTAQAIVSVLALALTVWIWRQRARHDVKAAVLILATMLATPYAFNYDAMLLGPGIAFLVADGLKHGFAPYEKSVLALLWVTPLFSRELTALTSLPIALIAGSTALVFLVQECRRTAVHPQPGAGLTQRV